MDIWQGFVVLAALIVVTRWYAWAQMRYWCGKECQENLKHDDLGDREGANYA